MKTKPVIEICMGSSCFSRGNSVTLEKVENYLQKLGLAEEVELKGRLCTGTCSSGPCVSVLTTQVTPMSTRML
jgi:NADH:ubiquinone oxidoreductase subunit E